MGAQVSPTKSSIPRYVPVLLGLPALLPLVFAWLSATSQGRVATGFIQYDMAYYMANAREHFDQGFRLTYGNPYAGYATPAIYFQPHVFLLALLERAGLEPGWAFNLFGLTTLIFAAMVAARLYEELVGWRTLAHKLGLVCFFWGGGLLSLAGVAFGRSMGMAGPRAWLMFDPNEGWWMLNFGRNLVYPTEAYYHGLFLLALLMLIRQRWGIALACTALLSASHPFTGLSLALTVGVYAAVEIVVGNRTWKLLAGAGAITVGHLGYYLVFLSRFSDHRAVQAQWSLDWPYLPWTFVPALYLVGFLAFTRFTRWNTLKQALAEPHGRLLLVCFTVVFMLTQHDLIMKPAQQIHFAHGYDWIALFFLGAPALMHLIERMLAIPQPFLRAAAVSVFLFVMLSDNLFWLASFRDPAVQRYTISLSHEERGVLDWLQRNASPPAIVVSEDASIDYLTSTYSKVRAWHGHLQNTPNTKQKEREVNLAFERGNFIDTPNPVYYIPRRERNWIPPPGSHQVYSNASFTIWASSRLRNGL